MKAQKWAVIIFPGSNCDRDLMKAFGILPNVEVVPHWYEDQIPPDTYQVIGIPGGFSFGDYLRAGAIAKLSPALQDLPDLVEKGANVIGICNGFQILLEMRLLPGFLQVNESLNFISRTVECEITHEAFPWFRSEDVGKRISIPIAHRFGNFQCSMMDRSDLQAVLRYVENPNGSKESIAGIYRKHGKGSLFGLMPHPERASFSELGLDSSKLFWKNVAEALS